MAANNPTTWADLDAANASHYASKKRPDWLIEAINAEASAATEHNEAVDEYMFRDGTIEAMIEAEKKSCEAQAWRVYCVECWYEDAQPVSTPEEIEAIVSAAWKR